VVKAENGRMAAAYSGINWGQNGRKPNPQGFLASIVDDPDAIGGHSFQKYAANDHGYVRSYSLTGPYFGGGMYISNRCDKNEYSHSVLGPLYGYGQDGVDPSSLFGVEDFRVLEYEEEEV
jgi:hypothetical protein